MQGVVVAVLVLALACVHALPVEDLSGLGMCKINEEKRYKDSESLMQIGKPEPDFGLPSEYVSELTAANMGSIIHPINQATIVNIFAPWCPVSQAFEPMFNELAEHLATRADLKFVKVNGDNDIELRHLFQVDSYPTVLVVKKGAATMEEAINQPVLRYKGRKTFNELAEWIDKMSHVTSTEPGNEALPNPMSNVVADNSAAPVKEDTPAAVVREATTANATATTSDASATVASATEATTASAPAAATATAAAVTGPTL